MEEKTLFKVALSLSLIGILIILIIAEQDTVRTKDIAIIKTLQLETKVKIKGTITKITDTPTLLILEIKDQTDKIKSIVYKEEEIDIQKSNMVEIIGTLKEYQNELEIEVSQIKIL